MKNLRSFEIAKNSGIPAVHFSEEDFYFSTPVVCPFYLTAARRWENTGRGEFMSGKKVEVNVKSEICYEDGRDEKMSFTSSGKLYRKRGEDYLVYREKNEGIDGARTTLKLDENGERVFLSREGKGGWKQEFIAGESSSNLYSSGQGKIMVKTETKTIQIRKNNSEEKDKGSEEEFSREVLLKYRLFIQDKFIADCRLKITAVEVN